MMHELMVSKWEPGAGLTQMWFSRLPPDFEMCVNAVVDGNLLRKVLQKPIESRVDDRLSGLTHDGPPLWSITGCG